MLYVSVCVLQLFRSKTIILLDYFVCDEARKLKSFCCSSMSIYIITDCRKDTAYLLKSPFLKSSLSLPILSKLIKHKSNISKITV